MGCKGERRLNAGLRRHGQTGRCAPVFSKARRPVGLEPTRRHGVRLAPLRRAPAASSGEPHVSSRERSRAHGRRRRGRLRAALHRAREGQHEHGVSRRHFRERFGRARQGVQEVRRGEGSGASGATVIRLVVDFESPVESVDRGRARASIVGIAANGRMTKFSPPANGRQKKKRGRLPPSPKDKLAATPAGRSQRDCNAHSFALNSIWNLRGSLTDAV